MKGFLSLFVTLAICQLAAASVFLSHSEKYRELESDVFRYNSGLELASATNSESSVLNSCNDVLNGSSGGISYKAFERISPNERCVWTIRGGNAVGFSLNVLRLGYLGSQDTQVVVTCLRLLGIASHVLVNQTGPVDELGFCNLLVITFASGSDVGDSSGFVVEYSALGSGNISPRSQDYIVNAGEAAIIRHPSPASSYDNNELTTFVIQPVLGNMTNVIYFRDTLEGTNCFDNLSVYKFNANSSIPTKWQNEGKLCGNVVWDIITSNDLIMITFDSDASVVGTGFQLAAGASSSNQC